MPDPTETLALLQHASLLTKISFALDVVLIGMMAYLLVLIRRMRRRLQDSTERLSEAREAMAKMDRSIDVRASRAAENLMLGPS